jgi:hypothetical protein
MEVREAVIVEEPDDGYPEEAADRRHASIMPMASAVRAQTKPFASKGSRSSWSPPMKDDWNSGYGGDNLSLAFRSLTGTLK